MQRLRSFLTIAWLVAAVSCGDAVSPDNDALSLNRRRWSTAGYHNYTMVMRRICFFCGESGPYNVAVVNDSVISATIVSDGRPVDARVFPTITKLFDLIEHAIDTNPGRVDVQYDGTLGYPREMTDHGPPNVSDVGIFYAVSDVKPLASLVVARE